MSTLTWLLSAEELKAAEPHKTLWCEFNAIAKGKRAQTGWTWQHKAMSYGYAVSHESLSSPALFLLWACQFEIFFDSSGTLLQTCCQSAVLFVPNSNHDNLLMYSQRCNRIHGAKYHFNINKEIVGYCSVKPCKEEKKLFHFTSYNAQSSFRRKI